MSFTVVPIDTVKEVMRITGHQAGIKLRPEMPTGPLNRVADNALARRLLEWSPKTKFFDGLRRTQEWYFATKKPDEVRAHFEHRLTER